LFRKTAGFPAATSTMWPVAAELVLSSSAALLRTPPSALPPEDWRAAFESQPAEFARVPLRAAGTVPAGLRGGTLYKNGPANFARGDVEYAHWLDGDGYVTALHVLPSGEAEWSGRYVCTTALDQEVAADAVLYRTTFGTQRPGGPLTNAFDIRLKSPANTNVLPFRDGLLALWEAGPPYELDPQTLACRGASSLGGRLKLSSAGAMASQGHGALPGTSTLRWLDEALEAAGLLTDACSAHPREDAHERRATVAWSWRQRLVGPPAIEIALHTLPHDEAAASTASAASAALAASSSASTSTSAASSSDAAASPSPPPPVRALLDDVAFAPHDMALSRTFALFVTSPTVVHLPAYILGLRGPAQCTQFVHATPMPGSRIHLVQRTSGAGEGTGGDGAGGEGMGGDGACGSTTVVDIGRPYHPVHHANAWEATAATAQPSGDEAGAAHTAATSEPQPHHVTLLSSCWPPEAVTRLAASGSSLLGSWDELVSGDFSKVAMTNLVRFVVVVHGSPCTHSPLHPCTLLTMACALRVPCVCPACALRVPCVCIVCATGRCGQWHAHRDDDPSRRRAARPSTRASALGDAGDALRLRHTRPREQRRRDGLRARAATELWLCRRARRRRTRRRVVCWRSAAGGRGDAGANERGGRRGRGRRRRACRVAARAGV
jgi:hypothetical protein